MTTTPERPATSSPDITSLGVPGQGAGALPGGVRAGRPTSQHPGQNTAGRRPGRGGGVQLLSAGVFLGVLHTRCQTTPQWLSREPRRWLALSPGTAAG